MINMNQKEIKRLGAISGIIAPIIFVIFTAISISTYPNYDPFTTYLSDLGMGSTAILFNIGVVVAGILGLVFCAAIFQLKNKFAEFGTVVLMFANVSLIHIGIFSEYFRGTHFVVSITFFVFATLAILIIGTGLTFKKIKLGYLSLILGFIVVVVTSIFGVQQITEHIAVSIVIIWTLITSFYLTKFS